MPVKNKAARRRATASIFKAFRGHTRTDEEQEKEEKKKKKTARSTAGALTPSIKARRAGRKGGT